MRRGVGYGLILLGAALGACSGAVTIGSETVGGPDGGLDVGPDTLSSNDTGGPLRDTGPLPDILGSDTSLPEDSSTPPQCPAAAPLVGHACSPLNIECEYGADPSMACTHLYRCTASGWESVPSMSGAACVDAGTCPATYPGNGTACVTKDKACSYKKGTCICADSVPTPKGLVWQCTTATSSCPGERPSVGSKCTDATGVTCDYDHCYPGGVTLTCEDGVWQTKKGAPCPP